MPPAGVDTNVLLRIFVDDDGVQHRQALELVKGLGEILVPTVVIIETVWVLRNLFKFPKDRLVQFLNAVLEGGTFVLENREVIELAKFAFAEGKAGFADYVILESARKLGAKEVFTFDREFARTEGVVLVKGRHR